MDSPHQNGVEKPHNEEETENPSRKMLPTITVEAEALPNAAKIPMFGKVLFLLCGIINFGFSFGFPTSLSVYFLDWQASFQENRAYTATIHATCVGTLNTAAIIPGLMMSRYGDRVTLLVGCLLASLGMTLSLFASSIPYMVVSTGILFGMGCCMINLPTIPCITSVFTKHQSIYIASACFGAGVMNTVLPFFYSFISAEYGWRGSHLIIAGLILHACISSLILTSYRSPGNGRQANGTLSTKDDDCENTKHLAENGNLELPKAGFLLEGVSMTSLHSSTFGSQMLGTQSRKNNKESVKNLKENGGLLKKSVNSKMSINTNEILFHEEKDLLLRIKTSHPFLFDPLYLIEALTSSFCLAALYSTVALMMDFTKTKGFTDDSVSVFFVFITFLCSMFGKIFSGVMNLIPAVHSFHLICSYGIFSSLALISLIYTFDYVTLCVEFALIGFVLGGLASGYPKCVLDLSTVDAKTYPLALGINNSLLGLFDVSLPVVMGYMVDMYQSYTLALYLYSGLSLGLTGTLICAFYLKNRRDFCCGRPQDSQ